MSNAVQWVRSLIFNIQMYVAMLVIGIIYTPAAIMSADGAVAACHAYCRYIRWSAGWMAGRMSEAQYVRPSTSNASPRWGSPNPNSNRSATA